MFNKSILLIMGLVLIDTVYAAGSRRNVLVAETVFTAFDTETTGLSREKDRLVEIGAVKFLGDGTVLASTNWLVNPEREIPFYATEVHGITTEEAAKAPVFANIWPAFEAFCDGTVLLAHNANFDVGFVQTELKRAALDAPAFPVADTLRLFRKWFPQEKSHSLGKLTESLGVSGDTYHRADADAFHIVNVFRIGMEKREDLNLRRLQHDAGGYQWLDGKRRR